MGLFSVFKTLFEIDAPASGATGATGGSRPPHSPRRGSAGNAAAGGGDLVVFSESGQRQRLEPALARGGEGAVHAVAGAPGKIVKRYHDKLLADHRRAAALRAKITALAAVGELRNHERFAWPQIHVFDGHRRWVGFAMRRVAGKPLNYLAAPANVRDFLPGWTRRHLVRVAHDLVHGLLLLEKHGVRAGDINMANFLLDPATGAVSFLDCDSYQVTDAAGRLHPCPVHTPKYSSPEFLDNARANSPRTVEHLRFSIAILLFEILTLGVHPYMKLGGGDPVENIRDGRCGIGAKDADGNGGGAFLPAVFYRRYAELPDYVRPLFARTFRTGHANPAARATLEEWLKALKRWRTDLEAAGAR
jgi:DNA-binding helix-hairpin-helix protein with protein kinase domain